jgi:hypothetical protein
VRVVDISVVDAYPEWRYAHQYFWLRLTNIVGSKSFFEKISKLNWKHP